MIQLSTIKIRVLLGPACKDGLKGWQVAMYLCKKKLENDSFKVLPFKKMAPFNSKDDNLEYGDMRDQF